MPSPAVELNGAVAYCMAFGSEAGLKLIDEIAQAAALRNCAPVSTAKGGFLFRAGLLAEAKVQFERAAGLTRNEREKSFFRGRSAACAS
jgi:predicted RNA polymerase sigma factor